MYYRLCVYLNTLTQLQVKGVVRNFITIFIYIILLPTFEYFRHSLQYIDILTIQIRHTTNEGRKPIPNISALIARICDIPFFLYHSLISSSRTLLSPSTIALMVPALFCVNVLTYTFFIESAIFNRLAFKVPSHGVILTVLLKIP